MKLKGAEEAKPETGTSTRKSTVKDFTRALELVTDKKQSGT